MSYELSTSFHGVPLPRVGRATFASYIIISLHVCGMFNSYTDVNKIILLHTYSPLNQTSSWFG